MIQDFKIRRAKISDAKELLKLYNQDKNLLGDNNSLFEIEDIKDYIKRKFNWMIVCESNNKIIGSLLALFWTTYAYLHLIIVDKDFRGKGIGKALMLKFEQELKKRNIKDIEAFTEEKNKPMQSLFKKLNYKSGKKFVYFSKTLTNTQT